MFVFSMQCIYITCCSAGTEHWPACWSHVVWWITFTQAQHHMAKDKQGLRFQTLPHTLKKTKQKRIIIQKITCLNLLMQYLWWQREKEIMTENLCSLYISVTAKCYFWVCFVWNVCTHIKKHKTKKNPTHTVTLWDEKVVKNCMYVSPTV